jgi:hypothetical protein
MQLSRKVAGHLLFLPAFFGAAFFAAFLGDCFAAGFALGFDAPLVFEPPLVKILSHPSEYFWLVPTRVIVTFRSPEL